MAAVDRFGMARFYAYFLIFAPKALVSCQIKTESPLGPRMCKDLCELRCGCVSYAFGLLDLSCNLDNTRMKHSSDVQIVYLKYTKQQDDHEAIRNSCLPGCRIFTTKTKKIRCEQNYKADSQKKVSSKGDRLLVAPYDDNRMTMSLLNPEDNSFQKYSHLKVRNVLAIGFISSSKSILISVSSPRKVYKSRVNSATKHIFKNGVVATSLHTDQEKQIVFLGVTKPKSGLFAMKTDKDKFQKIFVPRGRITSISADSKRLMVYARLAAEIIAVPYNGGKAKKVVRNAKGICIAFDPVVGVLYYNDDSTIRKMSLKTKRDVIVKKLSYKIYDMVFYEIGLYSIMRNNKISVLKQIHERVLTQSIFSSGGARICVIEI